MIASVAHRLRPLLAIDGRTDPIRNLVRSSGIYGLAVVIPRFVSLSLTPFLTHNISPADYGALTLSFAGIALVEATTQLGLGPAALRSYNFVHTSEAGRRNVFGTVAVLLAIPSVAATVALILGAAPVARLVFGRTSLAQLVTLAALVCIADNMVAPGLTWLRSEDRALTYSLLTIGQCLVTLVGTVVLVGGLHLTASGVLLPIVAADAVVLTVTIPSLLAHSNIRLRIDIAIELLAFGLPLVLNSMSNWVLQLMDRYLIRIFASLSDTATYSVGYTLGSALAFLVIAPFQLGWPTAMYAMARRPDAAQLFRKLYLGFTACLLCFGLVLALLAEIMLNWLYPATYAAARPIIPLVAAGWVCYGVYVVLTAGASLTGRTWLLAVYTAIAAGTNLIANLILIPRYGGIGAGMATSIAYAVLVALAYAGHCLLHPIPVHRGSTSSDRSDAAALPGHREPHVARRGGHTYVLVAVTGYRIKSADTLFRAAQRTRGADIRSSPRYESASDAIVMKELQDIGEFEDVMASIVAANRAHGRRTYEVSIYSHASFNGPEGSVPASRHQASPNKKQMTVDGWQRIEYGWAPGACLRFLGCNTGDTSDSQPVSFASRISGQPNARDVEVWGQTSTVRASERPDARKHSWYHLIFDHSYRESERVYLVGDRGNRRRDLLMFVRSPAARPLQVVVNGREVGRRYEWCLGVDGPRRRNSRRKHELGNGVLPGIGCDPAPPSAPSGGDST